MLGRTHLADALSHWRNARHTYFDPATPGDWTSTPKTVKEALDLLAAAGGGGGGELGARYLLTSATDAGALTAYRVLTPGVNGTSNAVQGLAFADGGATAAFTARQASGVFVTGVTGGTITDLDYWDDENATISAFTSDQDNVTVAVTVAPAAGAWKPVCTIKSAVGDTAVTLTQVAGTRLFTGSAVVAMASTETFHVETDDGGRSEDCERTRALDPPVITSLTFTDQGTNPDPYPGIQTQFGYHQTIAYAGIVENHATLVYVEDFEATSGQGLQSGASLGAADSGGAGYKTFSGTCYSGNDTNATARLRAYAKVDAGASAGPSFTSDDSPSGTTDVVCDQAYPIASLTSRTYPTGVSSVVQEALKDTESCTVQIADSNHDSGDTLVWSGGSYGSHWSSIADGGAWNLRVYTRDDGTGPGYWDDSYANNARVVVTRTEKNGHSGTLNFNIQHADDVPTVTIHKGTSGTIEPSLDDVDGSRLGSGSGSKNHTIRLQSNHRTPSSSTITALCGVTADIGSWLASWARSTTYYSRVLTIVDGDIANGDQTANTGNWSSLSVYNRAHRQATVPTRTDYHVGGFSARNVDFPGSPTFDREIDFGVYVVDQSLVTAIDHLSQTLSLETSPTLPPGPTEYSLAMTLTDGATAYDAHGKVYYWLDTAALESATTGCTHTIEEAES